MAINRKDRVQYARNQSIFFVLCTKPSPYWDEYQANNGLIIKSMHISMHVAQKWTRKQSVNKLLRYNSVLSQITYQALFHEVVWTGDSSTDSVLASLAAFSVTRDSISLFSGQYSPVELSSCKQTKGSTRVRPFSSHKSIQIRHFWGFSRQNKCCVCK